MLNDDLMKAWYLNKLRSSQPTKEDDDERITGVNGDQIGNHYFANIFDKITNMLNETNILAEKIETAINTVDRIIDKNLVAKIEGLLIQQSNSIVKETSRIVSCVKYKQKFQLTESNRGNVEEEFDFACESNGGSIVKLDDTIPVVKNKPINVYFGLTINTPKMVIQPSISPGECFAYKGSRGTITIKMMGKVLISSVSIGHIPIQLSPLKNLYSAPNDFSVWGLKELNDFQPEYLGSFSYNIGDLQQFQTFDVFQPTDSPKSFQLVRFNFTSNHGNSKYTCIYRIRVYGKLNK